MPCKSDYMSATPIEVALSRVFCLLGELEGRSFSPSDWAGYHLHAYGCSSRTKLDDMTRALCAKLQSVDVTKYSLEMQMWWRDHQAADKARLLQEAEIASDTAARSLARQAHPLRAPPARHQGELK